MKFKVMGAMLSLLFCVVGETKGANLRLSADHFSRTITARDTVYYWIEAFVEGNKAMPVNLRVLPNPALKMEFLRSQVTTPALVRLKVYALQQGHTGDHQLAIVASAVETNLVDTLMVWLHVVVATNNDPKLVLDVLPSGQLEKNVPQSLEGAIVPAKIGTFRIHLRSPRSKKDTILTATEVDTAMGLFHVNHVLTEHGRWRAFASWQKLGESDGPNSISSDSIFFRVKRSPLRLTVAAEDSFRYQKNPNTLRVLGQITPDYANARINIQVTDPDNHTLSPIAPPNIDPENGKFSANFTLLTRKPGIYQITATADTTGIISESYGSLGEITREPLYANVVPSSLTLARNFINSVPLTPTNGGGGSSSSCALTSNMPAGYGVIVVGDSPDYYYHLNMAHLLRATLIVRRGFRPQDILLRTLSFNPGPDKLLANVDTDTSITAAGNGLIKNIRDHLDGAKSNPNFAQHQGLLFFWIGKTEISGSNIIFKAGQANLDPTQVANIYGSAMRAGLWSSYNKGIVIMHVGNNSGRLLQNMGLNVPSGLKKHSISSLPWSGSNPENFLTECGMTTFSRYFIQAIAVDDSTVRGAFKYGRTAVVSPIPAIDHDINGSEETNFPNNYGQDPTNPPGQIKLGCQLSAAQLAARIRSVAFGSIIGAPQVGSEGTLYVHLDNPNRDPIRRVTLTLQPPKGSGKPMQCFDVQPRQPEESSILWKTQVNYPDSGLYRGTVLVEHEAYGYLDVATTSFDRVRYDTTTVRTVPPLQPPSKPDVFFDPHIEVGFNYARGFDPPNVRNSQNKPGGVIDVNFFSTRGGNLEFLGLGVASNFGRVWGMFMPVSASAGGAKALSNLWIYGGFGYELGHAKFIQEDLLYFVGVKYRLFSLKH